MGLMYQPSVLQKYHLPAPTDVRHVRLDAVALHKADPSRYLTYFPVNDGTTWRRCSGRPAPDHTSCCRTGPGR